MNAHRWFAVGIATMLTAGLAGAQASATGSDPFFRLDPVTRRQVEVLRDSANALGLPGRQLELKARQGVAMKADPKRIVIVVRQLFTNLRTAHDALDNSNESVLVAAASALDAKVSADELVQFRTSAKGRSPLTALTVLTDLIQRGVPRDKAVPTFLDLWKRGYVDETYQSLARNIDNDIISGKNPGEALTQRARDLPARPPGPPDDPEPPSA